MQQHEHSTRFESWQDVKGWEGLYRVSDRGRVWSLRRNRPLAVGLMKGGYLCVALSKGGRLKTYRVHRLVLEAFVGPRPEGMECCHNDGNPANNRLENLRWDTREANMADSLRHGTRARTDGIHNGRAKLTPAKVQEIRALREAGVSLRKIAAGYGVTSTVVAKICAGKLWGRV